MMDELIAGFSAQLQEALKIGKSYQFFNKPAKVSNVVVAGLGGSGIGGTIVQNYSFKQSKVPIVVCKNYFIPAFVNADSLVVICSYSGNTEETVACFKQAINRKARIVCITSGGTIADMAKRKKIDCIIIPTGMPPRACLGYSMIQLLCVFKAFKIINSTFENDIKTSISLINKEQKNIQTTAKKLASKIVGKTPVLYAENDMEGVAIRWRQQINENGKMLTWHHVIPEMNHNELVGWRDKNDKLIVLFLRSEDDYERNVMRVNINKKIIKKYAGTIDVYSKGSNYLERAIYLIHLGDWVSWYLSVETGRDATEVNVIDYLKTELVKN